MKLYAVRMFVHDWETAHDFYANVLGLPVKFSEPDVGWAEFDIEGVYTSLIKKGVEFTTPPEKQSCGGTLAHFRDPEGNILTLLG